MTATSLISILCSRPRRAFPLAAVAVMLLAGCGSSAARRPASRIPGALLAEARPIGAGPRFQPPSIGPVIGPCRAHLGRRTESHVELFAANRVVLVAAGIGTRPPRTLADGRITAARCYGELVTIDPTGIVLVRPGPVARIGTLFRSWGQRLSDSQLASFGRGRVIAFVDGRRWRGQPMSVPLAPRSEIVLEIGPYVPPHKSFTFPPGS